MPGALADLRRGIALGALDTDLLTQAAEILITFGARIDAVSALLAVSKRLSGPSRARVLRRLANLELDLGRYREGIRSYRRALELAPGATHIASELADHLAGLGDPEAALEVVEGCDPRGEVLGRQTARFLIAVGRRDDARASALAFARQVAEDKLDDLLFACELLIGAAEFDAATRYAQTAHERAAANDSRALEILAELASSAGRATEARALAEEALKRTSGSPKARRILATLDILSENLEPARRILDSLVGSGPEDGEALIWRGEIHRLEGRPEEAWTDLGRGIELTNGYPLGAHVAFVTTHAARSFDGNLDVDLYRELFQILVPVFAALGLPTTRPTSNQEIAERLSTVLGAMHGNRGPRPTFVHEGTLEAIQVPIHARFEARSIQEHLRTRPASWVLERLRALAADRPTESTVLCHVGEIELWLGNYDSAESAFLRAIEIAKETRWAYVGLCAAELGRNRPQEAIEWCARGEKEAMPGRTQFAYRGEAYRRLGDRENARRDLVIALELTPTRLSSWLNSALIDEHPLELESAFRGLLRHAPGLVQDACVELGSEWDRVSADPPLQIRLFEHVLTMMRGNRSSAFVTYFTGKGELRFVPPPGSS